LATTTVVVTHSQSQKAMDDVDEQAAAVLFVESNDGEIPSGFREIGDFVIR